MFGTAIDRALPLLPGEATGSDEAHLAPPADAIHSAIAVTQSALAILGRSFTVPEIEGASAHERH